MRPQLSKDPVLYHRDVYFPLEILNPLLGRYLRLAYTKNAATIAEGHGLPRPGYVILSRGNLIELGCDEAGALQTAVVQEQWGARSLYLCVSLDWVSSGLARVRTLWSEEGREVYGVSPQKYQVDPNKNSAYAPVSLTPAISNPVFA